MFALLPYYKLIPETGKINKLNLKAITMKRWILKNKLFFVGAALGAATGFLYWRFIGCNSGSCAITSSPINSTLYFSILGALALSMFKTKDAGNIEKK
ncbi:MAG TPA: DUF6132 family protein [Agriterribacter sp.]|nr:DUF6132 family protein [Agriterribacter sp.]